MLETIAILSNGIVIAVLGALYRKVNSQEKGLNNHIVNFTAEITSRPNFNQVDERIEKAEKRGCSKIKPLKDDLHDVKEKLFEHLLETK